MKNADRGPMGPVIAVSLPFLAVAILALSACAKKPDSNEPYSEPVPPELSKGDVVVDRKTGCEYISLYSDAITPRMGWDEKRQQMMQMGCRIVEHEI